MELSSKLLFFIFNIFYLFKKNYYCSKKNGDKIFKSSSITFIFTSTPFITE